MELNQFYAVIVAGGAGKRMGSTISKQYIPLNGLPILMHSILKFYQTKFRPKIVVVLPETDVEYWQKLVEEYEFSVPHEIVFGGEERFHSVKNAIELIDNSAIVAIHDAVRPLVSQKIIENSYEAARKNGCAVVAVPSKDSVRMLENERNINISRDKIFLVQTPQTFKAEKLKTSYYQSYTKEFTDDASVCEKAGFKIHIIEGDQYNFKITFPEDLIIAEALIKNGYT